MHVSDLPRSKAAQLLLVIGCALVLLVPALDTVLRLDPTPPPQENRLLANRPAAPRSFAAALAWPGAFHTWFADHFGLRSTFVETNARFRLQLLGVTPAPHRGVLIGRDGWLFYTGDYELDDYLRRKPLSPAELDAWCNGLEAQRRWLESRGIRMLWVLAPNKGTIYPEKLPTWVVTPNRPGRADQLLEALRSRTSVEILDLRPALLEDKQQELNYFLTDPHWNHRGGRVAYAEIMKRLQKWFPNAHPLTRSDYTDTLIHGPGEDLARMIGAQRFVTEDKVWLGRRQPARSRKVDASEYQKIKGNEQAIVTELDNAELGRLVLLGDSFGIGLQGFLSEHFSRAVFLWWYSGFPAAAIEKEHPDVVVVEQLERLLTANVPKAPVDVPSAAAPERIDDTATLVPPGDPGAAEPVTRAELAEMVGRVALGRLDAGPAKGTVYRDVTATLPRAGWIETVGPWEILPGQAEGNFKPDEGLTRTQLAIALEMFLHGSDFNPQPVTATPYSDLPATYSVAPWIMSFQTDVGDVGCGGGAFCPLRPATREEARAWLSRVAEARVRLAVVPLVESKAAPVRRGQLAESIGRVLVGPGGTPPPASGTMFSDVPADGPLAGWIELVAEKGYLPGYPDGAFKAGERLSRARLALVMLRLANGVAYSPPPLTRPSHEDVPSTSPWAPWVAEFVRRFGDLPCGPGRFCPYDPATVADVERVLPKAAAQRSSH
jgi:alginate O-acetyltransferase complex protein AlgJ